MKSANLNTADRTMSDVSLHTGSPMLSHRTWLETPGTDHLVQFYETDAFILDSLAEFIATGIKVGDAGIVVATARHLQDLQPGLRERGVDIEGEVAAGRFVGLEAEKVLGDLMVEGALSPQRFSSFFTSVLAQAAESGRNVRVFGELVALLWADGNFEAAIQLEQMWNDLKASHPFSLFCAYPMREMGNTALADSLAQVCLTHSRIIPAESYLSLNDDGDRSRAIAQLQQKALLLEAEVMQRRQAEERLQAALSREQMARGEAESANRMKDEFLATVSHELRTPLNAIIGWSHMLRSGALDANTTTRALETIERNAKSQAQLVEDILDVSRVITGKLRLKMGLIDAASIINAAIDSVQLAADSKGIQLEVILDPSARHILGDAGRLQQVVWNLLSNAIKFTPNGGKVKVNLERIKTDVQIRVSDTGQGISAEFLPCVFDRFRQADATSTRLHGGLGLGLAIVRHLVELHGGSVSVTSEGEGRGATFTIQLPAVKAKETRSAKGSYVREPEKDYTVESSPTLNGIRVLVVDDDRDTLQVLAILLGESKAQVQLASSSREAMEVLEWYRPDVLVVDIAMPVEDGYSLIRRVRASEALPLSRIPAVALTAHVRVEDRAAALSAGFNMFVPKPVEAQELVLAISNLASEDGASAIRPL